MGELKSNAKKADDDFMKSLFSDFHLYYQDKPVRGKIEDSNTDFMRAIKVTDSEPLLETSRVNKNNKIIYDNLPVAVEVIICSHFADGKAKYKSPIYTEMVWNIKTHFTISVDTTMLSCFQEQQKIPFKNIDDILSICNNFAQEQWNFEYDYWLGIENNSNAKDQNGNVINLQLDAIKKFYDSEDSPYSLRIGWATGMPGTTISLCYEDETLIREICDHCSFNNKAPGFEAPKSRRVIANKNREIKYLPGWVKFKVLELC
jgi:CRISPR-associated protein Csm5